MDGRIDRLERLAELRAKGALSEDEFNTEKAKLLGSIAPAPVNGVQGEAVAQEPLNDSDATRGSEETDPPNTAHLEDEAEPSLGIAADTSVASDADQQEEPRVSASDWQAWLKWPAVAAAIIFVILMLLKFGAVIAILIAITGLCTHLYAVANGNRDVKFFSYLSYAASLIIIFLTVIINFAKSEINSNTAELDQSSFSEVSNKVGCDSHYSDEMKSDIFKRDYEDKRFVWQGSVSQSDSDSIGLKIRYLTIAHDVIIDMDDNSGYSVKKGDNLKISFILTQQGGCFLPFIGDHGVIVR